MKLALWVARRHRPFAIVEDPKLVDIFMDLNNKVEVPSCITVSRDVKEIFYICRGKVAKILQVMNCLLSYVSGLMHNTLRHTWENYTSVLMVGRRRRSSLLLG
jgi:hypothetical protein